MVGNRLVVATDKGLDILRGMTWYHIDGHEGLCYHDTTALSVGFDRDLWIGTAHGASAISERNINSSAMQDGSRTTMSTPSPPMTKSSTSRLMGGSASSVTSPTPWPRRRPITSGGSTNGG